MNISALAWARSTRQETNALLLWNRAHSGEPQVMLKVRYTAQPSKIAAGLQRDGARVRRKVKVSGTPCHLWKDFEVHAKHPLLITRNNQKSLEGWQFCTGRFRKKKTRIVKQMPYFCSQKIIYIQLKFYERPMRKCCQECKSELSPGDPATSTLGEVSQVFLGFWEGRNRTSSPWGL